MKFEELKQALIDAAERAGIKEYEIYYQSEDSISAETLKDEISAFSSGFSGGICFRCIVDGKMGYASGELMTKEAMEELVEKAKENAACIDNDDEVFIFEGSKEYAKLPEREVKLTDASTLRETALKLQKDTYDTDSRVGDGTQTAAITFASEIHLCNSKGLNLSNRLGTSVAYVNAVLREGEEAQESFEFAEGYCYDDLKALPAMAVESALNKFGAGSVETGKYDIVMRGKVFRDFLSTFASVFSAKNAQKGLSLLAGKEGQTIASECVTLVDDPMREGCPMQTPFDGEGVATARREIISGGVLNTLLYDLTTAKKAGVESTGNGQKGSYASPVNIAPYSFGIQAGNSTREELFEAVGNGVFITSAKGFHAGANPVTGDFSIESEGFMIRNGKRAEAVKSFTIAGNFFELLKSVDRLGDTIEWGLPGSLTIFGSPDALIRGASIAGK